VNRLSSQFSKDH